MFALIHLKVNLFHGDYHYPSKHSVDPFCVCYYCLVWTLEFYQALLLNLNNWGQRHHTG